MSNKEKMVHRDDPDTIMTGYKHALQSARSWLKMFPAAEPIIAEIDKQLKGRPKGYFWMAGISGEWYMWVAEEEGVRCLISGHNFSWEAFDDFTKRGVLKWEAINEPSEASR